MGNATANISLRAAEALVDWWRLAGVEWFVADAVDPPEAASSRPPLPPRTASRIAGPYPALPPLPGDLDSFRALLTGGAGLPGTDLGGIAVAPRGDARTPLMIMTDFPEEMDGASGRLLSGPEGMLLDAMLSAAAIDPQKVYVASLAASRPHGGQLPAESVTDIAALARHHIALVGPARVWMLGSTVAEALFGATPADALGSLPKIYHQDGISFHRTSHLRLLLALPRAKREAWSDMLTLAKDWPPR